MKPNHKCSIDRLWNPSFISVFIAAMLFNLSSQMSNSLLSLYAKSTGAAAEQIGTLMSIFALTALIFRFIAGPAMNVYNRKRLLQMAMILFAIAYVGFSFSPAIADRLSLDVVSVMKFFRLLQGVGNAFGNACLLTIVADFIPKDSFSSGMGTYALSQSFAQAIGPVVAVKLKDVVGYSDTYLINSLLMFVSMIIIGLKVYVPDNGVGKMEISLKNMIAKEAVIPAMIVFFVSLGFTSINSFFLVYCEEKGIDRASLYFTVNAVSLMITKPMAGMLNDRYGFIRVAVPACILTAVSLVLIAYSSQLWHLLAIAVLNSFGYGAVQPALQSMCMKSVPANRRGSASSTNFIALDFATLLGPFICGHIAKTYGYTPTMWIVMSCPVFLSALIVILFKQRLMCIEANFGNDTSVK